MTNYRRAKVAPSKGLKMSTVAIGLLVMAAGAVGAKALTSPTEVGSDTVIVSQPVSNDLCSRLIAGHQCRIDAAIEAATR